jgi:prepilin-type N-terminal cleavage/methylation domain-containing protein
MWEHPIKNFQFPISNFQLLSKRNQNFQRGFGLLEVMISLSILLVILGAAIGLQITSTMGAQFAKHQTQAYIVAANCIEMVRQKRDSNWIDGNSETKYDYVWPPCDNSWTQDGVTFTRKLTSTEVNLDAAADKESKQLTVTVSWKERGKDRSISLWTYLTDWKQL